MTLKIEIILSEEQRGKKWLEGREGKMNRIPGIWATISCVLGDSEDVATEIVEEKNRWRNNDSKFTKVAERSKLMGSGISVNKQHKYKETQPSQIADNQT